MSGLETASIITSTFPKIPLNKLSARAQVKRGIERLDDSSERLYQNASLFGRNDRSYEQQIRENTQ